MKVQRHNRVVDWPKLGPSLLIATALVVAIRTARWAVRVSGDPMFSDVDQELDREVEHAVRITDRVLHALLRRKEGLFPSRLEPVYEATEDDTPA